MAPFFQQSVNLYAFVGPFSRCTLVVGLLPLRRTSWRVAEKPWVILEVYIYNTSISGFCAAIVAQAQPFSVFCLRANIFGSVPLLVSAIGLHGKSQRADWHTVISNGISLVLSRFRTARVQVYEGRYAAFAAHLVHGGCIVCRIKDQSGNIPVREKRFDAGKSVQHGRKVMAGSTLKDREDRQSRVGICEEIEVIAVVEEISGRIPAPIGIRLGEPALVAALVDALLMAVTGRVAALTV